MEKNKIHSDLQIIILKFNYLIEEFYLQRHYIKNITFLFIAVLLRSLESVRKSNDFVLDVSMSTFSLQVDEKVYEPNNDIKPFFINNTRRDITAT